VILQCFVLADLVETLDAIERAPAEWIAVISPSAMWAQRDWFPRLLDLLPAPFALLVPFTNEPAPDWQAAAGDSDDVLAQRAIARDCSGGVVDVTNAAPAAPVAAIFRREHARQLLGGGLEQAHARARAIGRVGLARSVFAIHSNARL
jgi:hypothetical protein